MKLNFEIFQVGDSVFVDKYELEKLMKNEKFIDNVKPDFAEIKINSSPNRIKSLYVYHGGSIVYELDQINGIWPQEI